MTTASIQLKDQFGTPPAIRNAATKRLVWKEFRQNVPLLAIFVTVLVIILGSLTFAQSPAQVARGVTFWAPIIWSFVGVFALTMGVFLFAPEKENGTSQLLCQLPITSGFVVRAKLWIGAATVLVFVGICALLQLFEIFALGHQFELLASSRNVSVSFGIPTWALVAVIIPIELFWLGALSSLFIKRTIFAVVIATVAFLLSWMLPPLLLLCIPTSFASQHFPYVGFASIKLLIYSAMIVGLIYGGRQWLGNAPQIGSPRNVRRTKAIFLARGEAPAATSKVKSTRGRVYSSLIWQSFRQYRAVFFWAIGLGIPLAFFMSLVIASNTSFQSQVMAFYFPALQFIVPLIGALLAFSFDQQDLNYRFFQQHVEHGRKLWLARLIPPALLSIICALVLVFSGFAFDLIAPYRMHGDWFIVRAMSVSMLSVFGAFAVGQFCSMFFRSNVFAILAVLLMICLGVPWVAWLYYLNSSPWLFFAPILFGMVAITWWRAPAWLADRNRIRERVLPWLTLVLITGATVGAFAVNRVVSVPDYGSSLESMQNMYASIGQQNRVIGLKRTQLLRDASELVRTDIGTTENDSGFDPSYQLFPTTGPDAKERLGEFLKANQSAMDLIHEADELNGSIEILNPYSISQRRTQVNKLRVLMAAEASMAELNGELERALELWLRLKRFEDEYPVDCMQPKTESLIAHWSELPGQSPELIKRAIDALTFEVDDWRKKSNLTSVLARIDFANWYTEWKNGNPRPVGEMPYDVAVANWPAKLMPWERERSKRIAHQRIWGGVRNAWDFSLLATNSETSFCSTNGTNYPQALDLFASRSAPQAYLEPNLLVVGGFGTSLETLVLLRDIQRLRYIRVRMALSAWMLDHESLPENLNQLVPEYLDKLPIDVFYGREFYYSSAGKDAQVGWDLPIPRISILWGERALLEFSGNENLLSLTESQVEQLIPANTPFLLPWSTFAPTTRFRYQYRPEPDSEPITNECYDLSDPQEFLGSYLFYDTYQLNLDDRASQPSEIAN